MGRSDGLTATESTDRFVRQRGLIPRDQLSHLAATVIGVGAIGRQVTLKLAAIGTPKLQLIDFDNVDESNVKTKGYSASKVGQSSVAATAAAITRVGGSMEVPQINDRYQSRTETGGAVFCCVDSISARPAIWWSAQHGCRFWRDYRMLGESIRILAVTNGTGRKHEPTTLFRQAERNPVAALPGVAFTRRTSRQDLWCINSPAGCADRSSMPTCH